MISFQSVKASIDFGLDFVNIVFSIEDTHEDLSDYRFDLLRGHSESDRFIPVHSNIQYFECNDYSASLHNPEVRNLYKIRATFIPTEFYIDSNIFTYPTVTPDRYAQYLSTIYGMYLDVIGNSEMLLLKRIRTGRRCDCYDDIRGARLSDKCNYCFGTGYAGGYSRPIPIKVNYMNPPSKQESIDVKGTFEETSPLQIWTTNYPYLQENDILVDTLSGIRYRIMNNQLSYKSGFLIRQTTQIMKIPESSKLYRIEVR